MYLLPYLLALFVAGATAANTPSAIATLGPSVTGVPPLIWESPFQTPEQDVLIKDLVKQINAFHTEPGFASLANDNAAWYGSYLRTQTAFETEALTASTARLSDELPEVWRKAAIEDQEHLLELAEGKQYFSKGKQERFIELQKEWIGLLKTIASEAVAATRTDRKTVSASATGSAGMPALTPDSTERTGKSRPAKTGEGAALSRVTEAVEADSSAGRSTSVGPLAAVVLVGMSVVIAL